jgi:hypothetical protein
MCERKGFFIEDWELPYSNAAPLVINGRIYTPEMQEDIMHEARSAWQIGIVFGQVNLG